MAMTLRPSEADEKAIDTLTEIWGVSRNEAVLRAVREEAQRQTQVDIMAASAQGLVKYAGLLDRLGNA